MRAVVDSSTLVSLAWAGLLHLVQRTPLDLVIPDVVRDEVVTQGLAHAHPDAAAIEAAIRGLSPTSGAAASEPDAAVLDAARGVDALVTNDATLGRRALNLGVGWLRTADLVVLAVAAGSLDTTRGRAAIHALHAASRISDELREAYLEELA